MSEMLQQALTLAVLALVVGGGIWVARKNNAEVKRLEEEEESRFQDAIARGELTQDGKPVCKGCGAAASECVPRTGTELVASRSKELDLTEMPWRYVILGDDDEAELCKPCRRIAINQLHALHAGLRADHAKYAAHLQQKLHMLERGGLVSLVKSENEKIMHELQHGVSGAGLLGPPEETPQTFVLRSGEKT